GPPLVPAQRPLRGAPRVRLPRRLGRTGRVRHRRGGGRLLPPPLPPPGDHARGAGGRAGRVGRVPLRAGRFHRGGGAAARVPAAFGTGEAVAASYLPLSLPLETTLAVRAGARAAWGEFPFEQAAFIGGSESLRGYPRQRYAGDAAVYGGVEARTFLTRINFI